MNGPAYVLLTDFPPLREGGAGNQVLAWNWLRAMNGVDDARLVITHLGSRKLRRATVAAAIPVPTAFYPDGDVMRVGRLPRLRKLLDFALFAGSLPHLRRAVRRAGARRIFALCGFDVWFLPMAVLLARVTGLPLEFYVVDDLEASAVMAGRRRWLRGLRRVERWALRRADQVWAISPGYVAHLREKYEQAARWLPVSAPGILPVPVAYRPGETDVRHLVFVGSVHFLYVDALRELHGALTAWNAGAERPFELRLQVLTRRPPRDLLDVLGPAPEFLDVVLDVDGPTRDGYLRAGWATFLPYAFTPGATRTMVQTSFSYKFTDALGAGRPILVYGPADGSIPRYFRAENLPLCATSPAELTAALGEIAREDTPELIARYAELARRHHSPQALRETLRTAGG